MKGIAIVYHSSCFWDANYNSWSNKLANTADTRSPDPIDDIIKADFIAGVSMAVLIGAGWVVPPVTVGGAGLTIGSAAVASGATALWYGAKWIYNSIGENTG